MIGRLRQGDGGLAAAVLGAPVGVFHRRGESATGADEGAPGAAGPLSGPLPWVIAIMVALTVVAAAAGLTLRNVAGAARDDLADGITVQLLDPRPEARSAQGQAALAVLHRQRGVVSARLVAQAEVDRLIEPWLGTPGAGAEAVPVPGLIDVALDGPASAGRVGTIAAALHRAVPGARVDAQAGWLQPVFGAIRSLQWLALALIMLLGAALAAAVLLATRTALGNHRGTIEIVHMLGGTDAQIARIFQRAIGVDAALGAGAGLVLAVLVVVGLGRRFADLGAGLVTGGALGWFDWVLVLLVPVLAIALALITARLSVLGALRRML